VARQPKAAARATRRPEDAAFRFLASGAAFVMLPLFLQGVPLGKGLSAMIPVGFVVVGIGVLLLFLGRLPRQAGAPTMQRVQDVPTLHTVLEAPAAAAVDGAIAELDRSSVEVRVARKISAAAPKCWGRDIFQVIEWRCFEAVVKTLFQQAGLVTKSQSHGADGGVDIWLYSAKQPDVPVGLVRCEHRAGKQVGVDEIRELRGAMAAIKVVGRGVFATTSTFTGEATRFAQENSIDLLDVDRLLSLIAKRAPGQQQALLEIALDCRTLPMRAS